MPNDHRGNSYTNSWVLEGASDEGIRDMTMLNYKGTGTPCICMNAHGQLTIASVGDYGTRFERGLRDKVRNTPEDSLIEDIVDHVLIWDR
jgi:hypothetical protein